MGIEECNGLVISVDPPLGHADSSNPSPAIRSSLHRPIVTCCGPPRYLKRQVKKHT